MLGKLFGKKKEKFFLELSEDAVSAIAEPVKKLASEVSASEPSESKAEATPAAKDDKKTAANQAAKPTAQKATSAIPDLSPAISKAAAAMPQETAQPEPMADPVEVIRNAIAAAGNQSGAVKEEETFDYTVPATTAPRRRPGPSMSPFKSLAKDLKKTSF